MIGDSESARVEEEEEEGVEGKGRGILEGVENNLDGVAGPFRGVDKRERVRAEGALVTADGRVGTSEKGMLGTAVGVGEDERVVSRSLTRFLVWSYGMVSYECCKLDEAGSRRTTAPSAQS